MTFETRTAIEPQDILGIEIECTQCKCRCVLPLNNFVKVPLACPNCPASWREFQEKLEKLLYYTDLFKAFSLQKEKPTSIHFEIANQPARPSASQTLTDRQ